VIRKLSHLASILCYYPVDSRRLVSNFPRTSHSGSLHKSDTIREALVPRAESLMANQITHSVRKDILKRAVDGSKNHAVRNNILLAIPPSDSEAILSTLELVDLPTHTIIHELCEPIKFGYFINEGLASVLSVMGNGKSVEVGLTGSEGFVGLPLVVGFSTSPTRVVMQIAGSAFKIGAADLQVALKKCPQLEKQLNRFSQQMGLQATQVAACNRLHPVEQRLARWLLMSQDRIGGDIVPLTQQFLAHMLGTRRASVTVAAKILQKTGVIIYTRGVVNVRDRRRLEKSACECYAAMTKQSLTWQAESK
jgi:CRP-like cAMP-binding protein